MLGFVEVDKLVGVCGVVAGIDGGNEDAHLFGGFAGGGLYGVFGLQYLLQVWPYGVGCVVAVGKALAVLFVAVGVFAGHKGAYAAVGNAVLCA